MRGQVCKPVGWKRMSWGPSTLQTAVFSPRALFTGLSKGDAFGKSPRQLTTARLKMDLDGRGDFEENWESELENIIFPAFLRVSKREARMLVRRGLLTGSLHAQRRCKTLQTPG